MLTELSLRQFRCHQDLSWRLGAGWNLLLGHNGQGKTSILEAIYYLSRMRSHRSSTTRELIQWGHEGFALRAQRETIPHGELFVRWEKKQKLYQVGGINIERLDQFWGQLPVVLISAEDIEILRGPALKRQQWLDSLIALETPSHLTLVQKYNAVLQQRNAALKTRLWEKRLHEALCQQLTDYGQQIVLTRTALTTKLKTPLEQISARLGQADKQLLFHYEPNIMPGEEPRWEEVRAQEQNLGRTLLGPHRDQLHITMRGQSVARYGSEGEQRLAVLLLRWVEAEIIRAKKGRPPIYLLDDVLNPLDLPRQQGWLAEIPAEAQVICTTTRRPNDLANWPPCHLWELSAGKIHSL